MKWFQVLLIAALTIAMASPAQAAHLKLSLTPSADLVAGQPAHITASLTKKDGTPVTLSMLQEKHTKKIHLLVIDPTLTDYHHLHPVEGRNPGEYMFDFTPKKSGTYRIWADVAPVNGEQEYVRADLGMPPATPVAIDKTTSLAADSGGYHFALALDGDPVRGRALMGKVTVTKEGIPFTKLEPVMGAYAHIVGFGEDYTSLTHLHPMGAEPTKETDRGGPNLEFHFEPSKAGVVKLFAQVRIEGKDIFAPFTVIVKPMPGFVPHAKPAMDPMMEHHH